MTRVSEVDERRRKRLAQTYEDAIANAQEENTFAKAKLAEDERDVSKVQEEIEQ